ncbi:hypothetical protein AWI43_04330 [Streptomyces sp. WAC04657]|nr:hypothetical protein AWI43_04330 [Streptomyces sp. WAC04657]
MKPALAEAGSSTSGSSETDASETNLLPSALSEPNPSTSGSSEPSFSGASVPEPEPEPEVPVAPVAPVAPTVPEVKVPVVRGSGVRRGAVVGAGEVGVAFTGFLGGGAGGGPGSVGRPGAGTGAGARREGDGRGTRARSAAARASAKRSSTAVACSSVRVSGGRSRTTAEWRPPSSTMSPRARHSCWTARARAGAAGGAVSSGPAASGSTSSIPIIRPRPRTSPTHGWAAARPWSCPRMRAPRVPARSASLFSRTYARVAVPAAMASWLPRKVPAWAPGSQASSEER